MTYPTLLIVMAAALLFHFAYCLIPSLRYFRARPAAYVIGAVAYGVVGVPAVADFLFGNGIARNPAYYITSLAILTIIAWRPYAFVRASGGPQEQNPD